MTAPSNHARLVLHVDGSRMVAPHDRSQSFGWGLVALHDDTHHEAFGHYLGAKVSPLGGHHEQIAFVHGVLYAREAGFDFRDVAIYCDCDIFGHGPGTVHPENYNHRGIDQLHSRLETVAAHAFDRSVIEPVMQAFAACRIHKVKGHRLHVYQERVDYLANFAARQGLGGKMEDETPLGMDAWLGRGLTTYVPDEKGEYVRATWRAPFVEPPQAE